MRLWKGLIHPSGNTKTWLFLAGCLVWAVVALARVFSSPVKALYPGGDDPIQPMTSLACPQQLDMNSSGDVVAGFANHSGQSQEYRVSFEVAQGGVLGTSRMVCARTVPVADGQTGAATCTVGPMGSTGLEVRVTAWAPSEVNQGACVEGCPNSYTSTCTIAPDVLAMLMRGDSLLSNTLGVVLGMIMIAVGAIWWRDIEGPGRIVMVGFYVFVALLIGLAAWLSYHHWLAVVVVIGPLVVALIAAVMWSGRRPA